MPSKAVTDAHTAAQRLHARLRTDYTRPVDIFSIVQQEGIWLASRPLSGGLFGFYLREGDAAGIVLNADHPEHLQRYTCAHELGHHILGHRSHLDQADDIIASNDGHQVADEISAQAFAGAFLMPLQAINRVQRRLGISKTARLDATDVYAISRELDVSFSASAWQLAALGRISSQDADRFTKQGSMAAKTAIRPGPPPEGDNRAALFVVNRSGHDIPILCRPGDELRLRLPENSATGYVWHTYSPEVRRSRPKIRWDGRDGAMKEGVNTSAQATQPLSSEPLLRLAEDRYFPDSSQSDRSTEDSNVVGQAGTRELVFLANSPGRTELEVRLSRPWESGQIDTFAAPVRIGPAHSLNGFAMRQVREHATRMAEG